MKIKAVRHTYEKDSPSSLPGMDIKKGDLECVKAALVIPCCLAMEEAWEAEAVGFGEKDDCGLNKVDKVCIYHCIPYPEGPVWEEFPIARCPWCGATIEITGLPS